MGHYLAMTLPTDRLLPSVPDSWVDKPLALVFKLLLALALAAAYDLGTIVLAVTAADTFSTPHTLGILQGSAVLSLAIIGQLLLLGRLLAKQRYPLACVVVLSAVPLTCILLVLVFLFFLR